jgi:hypothetical protein
MPDRSEQPSKTPLDSLIEMYENTDVSPQALLMLRKEEKQSLILQHDICQDVILSVKNRAFLIPGTETILENIDYPITSIGGEIISVTIQNKEGQRQYILNNCPTLYLSSSGDLAVLDEDAQGVRFLSIDEATDLRDLFDDALRKQGISLE